ncbi:MAG: DUF1905 domain-containing protein [Anaerolineae bacterium]
MEIEFTGRIWYWRGPAPWYFVTVPADESQDIKAIASSVTYGWGVIPVDVQIGNTTWYTSLIPKDDAYLVPIRADVRKAEQLDEGGEVHIRFTIRHSL